MRIEERLKELADSNPNYSLLWAQWEFDKKLLSRALNSISRDFPHYSLHDASHSSTIITQIEKVIAPNIEKLSATDCWLLLESCYWHDAGMIITHDDKMKILESGDFENHLNDLIEQNGELAEYAKLVLHNKGSNDIDQAFKVSHAMTYVISDFFRRIHATRSGNNVLSPSNIKVDSPRTILIPSRLFSFVADIVQCHGKDKTSLLSLEKYNDGMDANDYAHPRYVAALLRIGDLLDIDDGRFCPTLLANLGPRPQSSHDHQKKHSSIKSLLINSDEIKIRAECEGYGDYYAQKGWFEYIESEFDYQKRIWNEIVPDNTYRPLPTLGQLECIINGFITIDGKVPSITLDPKRVYDYITGSQIYSERHPFIREIIQNSIDATYYKVWEEINLTAVNDFDSQDKFRSLFNEELSKSPVFVDINTFEMNGCNLEYELIVKDSGIGMSLEEIKKILDVGSSSLYVKKRQFRDMPDWAKPAGYFGIGLQSAFKFCKKIIIKSKKIDHTCYELIVENSSDMKISLREVPGERFNGTIISAYFDIAAIPDISYDEAEDEFARFEPLSDQVIPFFSAYVEGVINDNFTTSPVTIFLNDKKINKKSAPTRAEKNLSNNTWTQDFELGVDLNLYVNLSTKRGSQFQYKGVEFLTSAKYYGISGKVNIFKEDAGFWLTIDRKNGRTDRANELNDLLIDVIYKHSENIRKNTKNKEEADFFIYSVTGETDRKLWRRYKINGIEVNDIINGNNSLYVRNSNSYSLNIMNIVSTGDIVFGCLGEIVCDEKISVMINFMPPEKIKKIEPTFFKTGAHSLFEFTFSDDNHGKIEIDIEVIKKEIDDTTTTLRTAIPCFNQKYKRICLMRNDLPQWVNTLSKFQDWVDEYVFLPRNEKESDCKLIYDFYMKKKLTHLSFDEFSELYLALWDELGI
ncbi:ATP-binding protein [Enterobacter cloacae]|nr:ATP-binding protein [Enterobacter cloacae]